MSLTQPPFQRWLVLGAVACLPLAAAAIDRPSEGYYSQPRVEFSFDAKTSVGLDGNDFTSSLKWTYADVEALLLEAGATNWDRLFSEHTPEHLDELRKTGESRRGIKLADLNNWFTVVVPSDDVAEDLAIKLQNNYHIRSASPTPIPKLTAVDIAPVTLDFTPFQDYHAAAPAGTGIASGWAQPGGQGQGINVLHCEGGWVLDHEDYDLTLNGGGNSTDPDWWNHGTACVSILGSPGNGYGVTGMTPSLDGLFSHGITANGGPSAWIAAMGPLNVGDVISASWGYSGTPIPGQVCVCNCLQFGGVPAEANQADFDAIQTVTANGYIVVNSASNGSMNLDDPFYGNDYDLGTRDSGALLIGAIDPGGVPTCWTNFGSRVDAHAWGSSVVSAGYGNLFNPGGDTRQWYTNSFGGTSAACPIVSGTIASAQGIFKSMTGGLVLDAWQFRTILRTTGTDQTGDFFKDVSNQPDMVQIISALAGLVPDVDPPVIAHTPLGNTFSTNPAISATINDASGVASATVNYSVDGGALVPLAMTYAGGETWTATLPEQFEGSMIEYTISATDGAGMPNSATIGPFAFTILSEAGGVVLLTPSTSPFSSGVEWETALTAAGYSGIVMNVDNLDGVVLGPDTDALIVLLGIFDQNYIVPDGSSMAVAIETFIAAGGNVYLEGGDVWVYDHQSVGGHSFNDAFGITGDADGGADLFSATGHGPLSGTWAYAGFNNWIDRLSSNGASLLFSNDDIGYDCGFYQNGATRTAGVSFELAGLSGFDSIVETLYGPALFNILAPELAYDPASLSGTALEGGSDTALLTLSNVGGQTLEWTASFSTLVVAAAEVTPEYEAIELAKGEADPRPGSAPRASGGPDGFGYHWIDSQGASGPAVNFQDISATGTEALLSDDDFESAMLSFGFPFYGSEKYVVDISSNGYLTFGVDGTDWSNDPIPLDNDPNDIIAPFWDDLNPLDGGTVHFQDFGDRFIVQWTEINHFQSNGTYTFQAILHDDGVIEYQYGELVGNTESVTIGIENADGTIGTQVVYNAPYLQSNMAIVIAPWLGVDTFTGSLPSGGSFDLGVLMDAAALSAGTYYGEVIITTNEPDTHYIPVEFVVTTGPRRPAQVTGLQLIPTDTDGSDLGLAFQMLFDAVTEDIEGNPLVVDHYILYWTYSSAPNGPYDPFPGSWIHGPVSSTNVIDFTWGLGSEGGYEGGYFIIVAVDQDGTLLASSRPELTNDHIMLQSADSTASRSAVPAGVGVLRTR